MSGAMAGPLTVMVTRCTSLDDNAFAPTLIAADPASCWEQPRLENSARTAQTMLGLTAFMEAPSRETVLSTAGVRVPPAYARAPCPEWGIAAAGPIPW